jgi:hypothetical protein
VFHGAFVYPPGFSLIFCIGECENSFSAHSEFKSSSSNSIDLRAQTNESEKIFVADNGDLAESRRLVFLGGLGAAGEHCTIGISFLSIEIPPSAPPFILSCSSTSFIRNWGQHKLFTENYQKETCNGARFYIGYC